MYIHPRLGRECCPRCWSAPDVVGCNGFSSGLFSNVTTSLTTMYSPHGARPRPNWNTLPGRFLFFSQFSRKYLCDNVHNSHVASSFSGKPNSRFTQNHLLSPDGLSPSPATHSPIHCLSIFAGDLHTVGTTNSTPRQYSLRWTSLVLNFSYSAALSFYELVLSFNSWWIIALRTYPFCWQAESICFCSKQRRWLSLITASCLVTRNYEARLSFTVFRLRFPT